MDCSPAVAFVRHRVAALRQDNLRNPEVHDDQPLTSLTQRKSRSRHSRLGFLCTSGRLKAHSSNIRRSPKSPQQSKQCELYNVNYPN